MSAVIESIWRHPVKGFTPEPLGEALLSAGAFFPCDRLYAVEDGPSGFDSSAPVHISKQKFTVLAKIPAVARIRTAYDEADGTLTARLDGRPALRARLTRPEGREAFARWLTEALGEEVRGPLKVLQAPGAHRFMDHPQGAVSIINLASVREIEARLGRPVDPRRFRANLYVEGWPAWSEYPGEGHAVRIGEARGCVLKPIQRCIATHVDPATGERDIEMLDALWDANGHLHCGIYVTILESGRVGVGDEAVLGD
jgi:uncharacterized protein YcbX